jgi:LysM repeat protein
VVVLVLLLLLAGLGLILAATASRAADPAGSAPTAEVRPGDTLWSIAVRYVPGRDPVTAVEEIRRLNGLTDYTIHAGQHVILPAHRWRDSTARQRVSSQRLANPVVRHPTRPDPAVPLAPRRPEEYRRPNM